MLIRIIAALVFALALSAGQRADARTPEEILQQDYHFTQDQINQLKKGPRKLAMPIERRFAPLTAQGCPLPFILQNGTIPDATQVMADFYALQSCMGGGGGAPINLGLSVPTEFLVTGSPYLGGSDVFAITKAIENPNTVWAGPVSGTPQPPSFRHLVPADCPIGTLAAIGCVQPDGSTITVTSAGVISAIAASATCATLPAGGCPFDIAMFWPGQPPNSQIVRVAITRSVNCIAGLGGSQAISKEAATGTPVVTINQVTGGVGSARGSFTWGASGTTGSPAAASAFTFAAGDIAEFAFPATADPSLGDIAITLKCSRV